MRAHTTCTCTRAHTMISPPHMYTHTHRHEYTHFVSMHLGHMYTRHCCTNYKYSDIMPPPPPYYPVHMYKYKLHELSHSLCCTQHNLAHINTLFNVRVYLQIIALDIDSRSRSPATGSHVIVCMRYLVL